MYLYVFVYLFIYINAYFIEISVSICLSLSFSLLVAPGISGAVRVARHKVTGRLVAVKTLNIARMPRRRAMLLYNEVAVYLQLDHPNIAKLLDVFVEGHDAQDFAAPTPPAAAAGAASFAAPTATSAATEDAAMLPSPVLSRASAAAAGGGSGPRGSSSKCIRLVMELCTGKELYERLAKRKKYSEKDAARITRQMLAAINYCHQHSICHRDLKYE